MMIRSHVKKLTYFLVLVPLGAGLFGAPLSAQNVSIDADDIGGLVTSANGPEGGVWVIAETTGSAHQVCPDRRHLGRWQVCHPRPSRCQL